MTKASRSASAAVAVATLSPLLAGLDTLIDLLEREAAALAAGGAGKGTTSSEKSAGAVRGVPASGTLNEQMEDLDLFIHRLKQIRDWLRQDPRLLPVVDGAIGKQVRDLERRQSRQNVTLAVVTTVGGAILGWLISLLGTPATVLHLFGH